MLPPLVVPLPTTAPELPLVALPVLAPLTFSVPDLPPLSLEPLDDEPLTEPLDPAVMVPALSAEEPCEEQAEMSPSPVRARALAMADGSASLAKVRARSTMLRRWVGAVGVCDHPPPSPSL